MKLSIFKFKPVLGIFLLLTISFSVITSGFVSAQQDGCIKIQLSRQSFLSGEVFQAEITGSLQKPLQAADIFFFYGNNEYSPAFGFEQAAADKWIVWMNTPRNYGANSMRVRALCQTEILLEEVKNAEFTIQKPIQDIYSNLLNRVNEVAALKTEELSLSLIALSHQTSFANRARDELLKRSSSQECWPAGACEVKTTSLALTALKNLTDTQKMQNWILDSQNNVNIGLWDLIAESNSAQSCSIIINGQAKAINLASGPNPPISLELPDDPEVIISTNCSLSSSRVSHTYLGRVNSFQMLNNGSAFSLTLNNKKCWGKTYRSGCEATPTAYALVALSGLGISDLQKEITWLSQNLETTEERAIYYSFTKDSATESWLVNNQAPQGYWSSGALAVSNVPSISATTQAVKALPESRIQKSLGESWLKSVLDMVDENKVSTEDLAFSLQFLGRDKIEPLIYSKGLIKTSGGKNFTINFQNNGVTPAELIASLSGKTFSVQVRELSSANMVLESPQTSSILFDYIEISYVTEFGNERGYKLPIILFPSSFEEGSFSGAINQTTTGGRSLLPSDLEFSQETLNLTLKKLPKNEITITLKNLASTPKSASISVSGLYELLEGIEPSSLELQPNEEREIRIIFNTERAFGAYTGSINAETAGSSTSLPVRIEIGEETTTKTCSEINGRICGSRETCSEPTVSAADGNCCLAECRAIPGEGGINLKIVGWVLLAIAAILAGLAIYFKLKKKPQQPIRAALERAGKNQANLPLREI